jgi:hypothetical protein
MEDYTGDRTKREGFSNDICKINSRPWFDRNKKIISWSKKQLTISKIQFLRTDFKDKTESISRCDFFGEIRVEYLPNRLPGFIH